jgi:hypothetical protein
MNLDERGRRAASSLEQHTRHNTDGTRSLEALYRQHTSRNDPRHRRPAALVIAFAIVIIAVLLSITIVRSSHSSTPPASHNLRPPASPTAPTTTAPTTTAPTTTTVASPVASCVTPCITVTVVDASGNPFPPGEARGLACPVSGAACVTADADSHGVAHLQLTDGTEYKTNGAVVNVGWCQPGFTSSNGDQWWFSENLAQGPPSAADGTTFRITQPTC